MLYAYVYIIYMYICVLILVNWFKGGCYVHIIVHPLFFITNPQTLKSLEPDFFLCLMT